MIWYSGRSSLHKIVIWSLFVDGWPMWQWRCCIVYTQDLLDECQRVSSVDETLKQSSCLGSQWRSVVVIVPMRLGGETINSMYVPCLKSLLNNDHCIGLIGGKPKHSLYFVGWQGIFGCYVVVILCMIGRHWTLCMMCKACIFSIFTLLFSSFWPTMQFPSGFIYIFASMQIKENSC